MLVLFGHSLGMCGIGSCIIWAQMPVGSALHSLGDLALGMRFVAPWSLVLGEMIVVLLCPSLLLVLVGFVR